MDSRGKSKLALMIFHSLSPTASDLLFMKLVWVHLSNDFFWLTVYYVFISLEMAAAGSLINGSKSCFCQSQTNKKPLSIHKAFCFSISKTSTISLKASLKSDAPVPLSVSTKGFFYPVVPGAEVPHWVMDRTQPAALESKGRERERKRDVVLGRLRKSSLQNVLGRSME